MIPSLSWAGPPDGRWRNWAGDESCTPATIARPGSVGELADTVRRAGDAGQPIRVVGAGHSFGDLVCTDGVLISLDRLTGLVRVDAAAGLVTVAAGTRLHELNLLLAQHGLALQNLGDIDRQSVGGAISTATHGTGRLLGNLATQVDSLDLVLADGSVITCTEDTPDRLRAARVSLGALGVVASYTLRVVPTFTLRSESIAVPLAETLATLDELVDGNDHFEFFLFPHTQTALTKRNNRTDEPATPQGLLARRGSDAVENGLLELLCRAGRRAPSQIPRLNRALARMSSSPSVRTDTSHRVYANTRSVRFTESEWAVPRSACADMVTEIGAVIERQRLDVNFPIEVRFVAADEESFLSPSYARETAYLAVHMYRGMPWRPFFQAVQAIADAHEGRPHWGKRHLLTADDLAGRYPGWERFQAVRAELDPAGRFTNDHVRRVLGPVQSPAPVEAAAARAAG